MKSYGMRIVLSVSIIAILPVMILSEQKSNPALNLKNKSDSAIQIRIDNGPLTPIAANKSLEIKSLDVKKISKIYIFYCPTKTYCKNKKPDMLLAEFGPGGTLGPITYTTMYLKFSIKKGKGHLEPQKGSSSKKDSSKETTDGYSLSNNIKAKNIEWQKTAKEDEFLYKSAME